MKKLLRVISFLLIITIQKSFSTYHSYHFANPNITEQKGGDVLGTLSAVLYSLDQFDSGKIDGLTIDFGTGGRNYASERGPNWWSYFYSQAQWGKCSNSMHYIPGWKRSIYSMKTRYEMNPIRAHELFKKYLGINPEIVLKVESYFSKYFSHVPVIGICFLQTDSFLQPSISLETLAKAIKDAVARYDHPYLFIVTNDALLQSKITKSPHLFPAPAIISEFAITKQEYELFADYSERVLINTLILSLCDTIISTDGTIADCISFFNPHIDRIMLNTSWHKEK